MTYCPVQLIRAKEFRQSHQRTKNHFVFFVILPWGCPSFTLVPKKINDGTSGAGQYGDFGCKMVDSQIGISEKLDEKYGFRKYNVFLRVIMAPLEPDFIKRLINKAADILSAV